MSTTSACQAVFKHKDRDSITAEWLLGVTLHPERHTPANGCQICRQKGQRSNQSAIRNNKQLPSACAVNITRLGRRKHTIMQEKQAKLNN